VIPPGFAVMRNPPLRGELGVALQEFRALQRYRRQGRAKPNCDDSNSVVMACFIECRDNVALFVNEVRFALSYSGFSSLGFLFL
jgi:hypothetical protein